MLSVKESRCRRSTVESRLFGATQESIAGNLDIVHGFNSKETLSSRHAFDLYDERVCEEVQIYKRTSKHSLLHAVSHRNESHPRRQLPPPQVRGAGRPRRGDPEQRVPVGILEHGVVPGLAGADPGRDGGNVQGSVDHLARGGVGGDGVADGEGACVAEQAGWEE